MMPVDAVLAVTYRCNARCAMCGIWNSKPVAELPPAVYARLPSSLRDVNLTGGEPFLRDDLPEIHAAVRSACPRARTVVSTNGLLTDRIVAAVRAMASVEPEIGVAVSVDGPPEIHDRLRGVPGAHERAMATVRGLQEAGFRNLRLAFTATRENANCLGQVYALARELRVEFTCALQHGSEHYFHVPAPEARPIEARNGAGHPRRAALPLAEAMGARVFHERSVPVRRRPRPPAAVSRGTRFLLHEPVRRRLHLQCGVLPHGQPGPAELRPDLELDRGLQRSSARRYLPDRLLDDLHGANGDAPGVAASAALGARPLRRRRPLKTEVISPQRRRGRGERRNKDNQWNLMN